MIKNGDAGSASDVAAEPHNAYDNSGKNSNRSDSSADADGIALVVVHCGNCCRGVFSIAADVV